MTAVDQGLLDRRPRQQAATAAEPQFTRLWQLEAELRHSYRSRRVPARPLSSRSTGVTLYDRFTLETGYSAIHASGWSANDGFEWRRTGTPDPKQTAKLLTSKLEITAGMALGR